MVGLVTPAWSMLPQTSAPTPATKSKHAAAGMITFQGMTRLRAVGVLVLSETVGVRGLLAVLVSLAPLAVLVSLALLAVLVSPAPLAVLVSPVPFVPLALPGREESATFVSMPSVRPAAAWLR